MSTSVATAVKTLRATRLGSGDADRWDRFVESCPEATFFHRSGWRTIIENVFGHEAHYLMAESSEGIEAVLPLGRIKSRLFGDALISVPFGVYGGAAAHDESARRLLEDEAEALALDLGVDYLEMRNRRSHRADWPTKDLYVTFRKTLHPEPEANLKAIPRKQRAMVRKGMKAGLTAELDDDVSRFYRAYATSVRNLGTPVYPERYFRALADVFGDQSDVLTITKGGRTVAGVLSFYFRDEVLPYYGGGADEARALKANDFMYWELMRRSVERGYRVFDYGRSKVGTGSYSFKKNWGFVPEPLPYQYRLVQASEVPNVSPANPKYRLLVKTWQRLPVSVSTLLGPLVSRHIA